MSVNEYTENNQKLYVVRVTVRSKKNRELRIQKSKKGLKTKSEAERVERELVRLAFSELSQKELKGSSYGQLVDEYELALREGTASRRTLTPQTQQDYVNVLRTYTSAWWERPAEEITPADVREVLVEIEKQGKSRARQQRVKSAIESVFRWGIETRRVKNIFASPSTGVSLVGRLEEKVPEILNIGQIRHLLSQAKLCDHRWYPIWFVALSTGCRSGELYALEWSDIDFEHRTILISKSFNKRTRQIGPTKAGTWRKVPMNADLEKFLKVLKLQRGDKKNVLPRGPEWASYRQAQVLRQFCKEVGIPSVRFHALRACFATQLIKDGVAPSVVMTVCGWKDLKTMQRYIRQAGIETDGATESLKIMPSEAVMGRVMELFSPGQQV